MSGSAIIAELLRADVALAALVPAERIKGGRLPDGIALPALLVRTISGTEWQALERGATVPTTDRVAVAVRAESYREQRALIRLIVAACAGRTGSIAGFDSVAVLTAGTGPDGIGPGDSYEQTQDFRVSFDAPA